MHVVMDLPFRLSPIVTQSKTSNRNQRDRRTSVRELMISKILKEVKTIRFTSG